MNLILYLALAAGYILCWLQISVELVVVVDPDSMSVLNFILSVIHNLIPIRLSPNSTNPHVGL